MLVDQPVFPPFLLLARLQFAGLILNAPVFDVLLHAGAARLRRR